MFVSVPEEYDLVILGSGEGGKYLAWTFAKQGKRVAVVERKLIGGACPNIACLPSKNVIHSAKVASYLRRGAEFGMRAETFSVDMVAVRNRKRQMVDGLVKMHLDNFGASGAELVMGTGRFVAPMTLEVSLQSGGARVLRGQNVVIDTGSRARLDNIPGLAEAKAFTHVEALELDYVPPHLLILGGGYIGLEFAQAMRRFGSRVTVVDRSPRLATKEDEDVSAALTELCQDEEIELVLGARVMQVSGVSGNAVTLQVEQHGQKTELQGTDLFVAAGRTPNTQEIGLEVAGVEVNERGHITVNEHLETTAPGVFAIGDCAGSPHFTHVSFDDFRVVRDNLIGKPHVTAGRQVPFCLFTDPELARIGLNETEARQRGIPYRSAKVPMAAVLRTRTLSETRGFMKALVEVKSDQILGITVFGAGAGEIMGAVQIAMIGGMPYTALRDAVFTHPTLLEGLIPLFSAIPPVAE